MKTKSFLLLLTLAAAGAAGLIALPEFKTAAVEETAPVTAAAPAVTAARVKTVDFRETVLVTGSLVPREEILVAPEVDGLKVLELRADEGDRVKKGDVLAILVSESLDAQIAQSDANIARARASIARAKSQIIEAEARLVEAQAALKRAKPLVKSEYLSESIFDQRKAAAQTAEAQLTAAHEGMRLAEAEKAQAEAQRREIEWRRGNTEVRAPEDGLISRRGARIGSISVGATVAGAGEPFFRIISKGEIELDAEVVQTRLAKIKNGQTATVRSSGTIADGKVRLVSPEIDRTTRLGRVRIFLGDNPDLKIGAFAKANVETASKRGLAVPLSAVLYSDNGATVLVIENGQVASRRVETGLVVAGQVEVMSGLKEGDVVVARAGTFLRDGDAVTPILPSDAISEAR